MDVGDNAFEMSTNALSSDSKWELSSPSSDTIDGSPVPSGPDTSSHTSFIVRDQFQLSGDEHDVIPLYAGFERDQWVGLDVILLNEFGDPVADGICKNSEPRRAHLEFFASSEVPLTWRFSLCRWPLCRVLHDGVSWGIMGGGMNKWSLRCWPQCVLAKDYAYTILVVCLAQIRCVDEIAYWMTILSSSVRK